MIKSLVSVIFLIARTLFTPWGHFSFVRLSTFRLAIMNFLLCLLLEYCSFCLDKEKFINITKLLRLFFFNTKSIDVVLIAVKANSLRGRN